MTDSWDPKGVFDYFVVGKDVALRSWPVPAAGRVAPSMSFWALAPGRVLGVARAELVGARIVAHIEPVPGVSAAAEALIEAARLLLRVCAKIAPFEVELSGVPTTGLTSASLRADGLAPVGPSTWRSGPWKAPAMARRAGTMDDLYRDPLQVVWNFEPCAWELLGPLLQEPGPVGSRRVLDSGCGFGKSSVLLEEAGFDVHGVDLSARAIVACRRWVRSPEQFRAASAQSLPFPARHFDVVLDVGCLHCLAPRLVRPALKEIRRVLRKGGRFFSRHLKPRDAGWLASQSYRVKQLGRTTASLRSLLDDGFELSFWETPETTCVRAVRR